jgi:YVTN family beta-propeller protein
MKAIMYSEGCINATFICMIKCLLVTMAMASIAIIILSNLNTASADSLIATIPLSDTSYSIAFDSTNNKIYVTNPLKNITSVIDGVTNSIVETIATPNPVDIAFNPVNHMIYVTNGINYTLTEIDPSTDTVSANISLSQVPGVLSIAINSDNGMIYAGGIMFNGTDYQETIFVVDPSSHELVDTIAVNLPPGGIEWDLIYGMAYNPVNRMLYATYFNRNLPGNDSVLVIDTSSNTIAKIIPVERNPIGVAVDPNSGVVYVASTDAAVTLISGTANTVFGRIVAPEIPGSSLRELVHPFGITFNPDNGKAYVTAMAYPSGDGYVFTIDSTINSISEDALIWVGSRPTDIAYDSINRNLYVTSSGTNSVSVISSRPTLQQSLAICPAEYIQHWDKIIFSITDPDVAEQLNLTANTGLDIKVQDDPQVVTDIKQKVLDFLTIPANLNQTINILDVGYSAICARELN